MKFRGVIYSLVLVLITSVTVATIYSLSNIDVYGEEQDIGRYEFFIYEVPEEMKDNSLLIKDKDFNISSYIDLWDATYEIYGDTPPGIKKENFPLNSKEKETAVFKTQQQSQAVISSEKVASIENNISLKDRVEVLRIVAGLNIMDTLKLIDIMKDGITREEQDEMYYLLKDKLGEEDLKRLIKIFEGYVN